MKHSTSVSNFSTLPEEHPIGSALWIEACWNAMRERARNGEAFDAHSCISMIPDANAEQIADLVYGEFVARRDCGETVSAEQYLSQYPQIAEQLARQFALDESLSEISNVEPHPDDELAWNATVVTATASTVAHRGKASGESGIGRYVLVDRLQRGAQAEVYRAYDPVLKRDVLIKIELERQHNGEPGQQRLFSDVEAIITANLNHPNIAPALDAGEHDGRVYSVSRFIRGRTFDQWVRDCNPDPRLVAQMIAKVARGLAHAHQNAVLHLDVKPRNIVVDENREPYLIDFGLSVACDAYTSQALVEGSVRGTLQFMAPEQLKGDVDRIGPCSDIFGLGATLFMGWVGRPPYDAPRSENDLRSIERCEWHAEWLDEAGLNDDMKSIVRRALAASPGERFPTCESFADELDRVSKTDPQRKIGVPSPSTRSKWATMWSRTLPGAAACILLLGFVSWLRPDSTGGGHAVSSASDPVLEVVVTTDDGGFVDLAGRVPLVSGDKLRLTGLIPAKQTAKLVAFSPDGSHRVISWFEHQDESRTFQYPNDPGQALPLVGPGGTEVVALVTAASADVLNQMMNRLEENPTPWELIPDSTALNWRNVDVTRMPRGATEISSIEMKLGGSSRALGGAVDTNPAVSKLSEQLKKLSARLNREGIAIHGVAFRHLDGESAD